MRRKPNHDTSVSPLPRRPAQAGRKGLKLALFSLVSGPCLTPWLPIAPKGSARHKLAGAANALATAPSWPRSRYKPCTRGWGLAAQVVLPGGLPSAPFMHCAGTMALCHQQYQKGTSAGNGMDF